MGNDNTASARRRALAEALRKGEDVVVTPTGETITQDVAIEEGQQGIKVPEGKLA